MSFSVSKAKTGPFRLLDVPYLWDNNSSHHGAIELNLWEHMVDQSPLLENVLVGSEFVGRKFGVTRVSDVPLTLFQLGNDTAPVELYYSHGYVALFWESDDAEEVLDALAQHLNSRESEPK